MAPKIEIRRSNSPNASPFWNVAYRQRTSLSSAIFKVSNIGDGVLAYTATVPSATPWLSVSPTAATEAPSTLTLTIDTDILLEGKYTTYVEVTAAGASNSPFLLPVYVEVLPPDILYRGDESYINQVKDNIFLSTAEGMYLTRLAKNFGFKRPNIGFSDDDLFRAVTHLVSFGYKGTYPLLYKLLELLVAPKTAISASVSQDVEYDSVIVYVEDSSVFPQYCTVTLTDPVTGYTETNKVIKNDWYNNKLTLRYNTQHAYLETNVSTITTNYIDWDLLEVNKNELVVLLPFSLLNSGTLPGSSYLHEAKVTENSATINSFVTATDTNAYCSSGDLEQKKGTVIASVGLGNEEHRLMTENNYVGDTLSSYVKPGDSYISLTKTLAKDVGGVGVVIHDFPDPPFTIRIIGETIYGSWWVTKDYIVDNIDDTLGSLTFGQFHLSAPVSAGIEHRAGQKVILYHPVYTSDGEIEINDDFTYDHNVGIETIDDFCNYAHYDAILGGGQQLPWGDLSSSNHGFVGPYLYDNLEFAPDFWLLNSANLPVTFDVTMPRLGTSQLAYDANPGDTTIYIKYDSEFAFYNDWFFFSDLALPYTGTIRLGTEILTYTITALTPIGELPLNSALSYGHNAGEKVEKQLTSIVLSSFGLLNTQQTVNGVSQWIGTYGGRVILDYGTPRQETIEFASLDEPNVTLNLKTTVYPRYNHFGGADVTPCTVMLSTHYSVPNKDGLDFPIYLFDGTTYKRIIEDLFDDMKAAGISVKVLGK